MAHFPQVTHMLIFLESKGITDEQIIERLEISKSTLDRWWNGTKPKARKIAKLEHWISEYRSICESYHGRRPPEYLYSEALEVACDEVGQPYSWERRKMRWPSYYSKGIPAVSHRKSMTCPHRRTEHQNEPTTDFVIETIIKFHPSQKVREDIEADENASC